MDLDFIFSWLVSQFPLAGTILQVLGALVVLGYSYVLITPTQTDDAWFAKLEAIPLLGAVLKAIKAFSPIQRK